MGSYSRAFCGMVIFGVLLTAAAAAQSGKAPIQITADLSDAPRKIYHAEVDLPVTEGPLTLTTPKWIPGHHMPAGPAGNIVGVVFTAAGQPLAWRRDDVDLYKFHLTIPAGVATLHAHLDCIVTANASQKTAVLDWEWAHAGDPVEDLAWCEWIIRMHHGAHVGALGSFFGAYGQRPAWAARQQAMVAQCRNLLALSQRREPSGTSVHLWAQRLRATESWAE